LLRTFIAQLAAATKICLQPRQNGSCNKTRSKRGFSDTSHDDVILISGEFFVDEENSVKTRSMSHPRYKAKSKQTKIDQSALSVFRKLLHR